MCDARKTCDTSRERHLRERSTHSDRERHVRERCTHTHTSATLLHHISLVVSKETERDMCERDTVQERAISISFLMRDRAISKGDRERCHRKSHLFPSHLGHIRQRQISVISDRDRSLLFISDARQSDLERGRDVIERNLALSRSLSLSLALARSLSLCLSM